MSSSTGVLWRILRENNPIAAVYYPELVTRTALIESLKLLAPPGLPVKEATEIDAAFADPDKIVVLLPDDEAEAVAVLDRRREELRDRTAPVVLFLLCDGSGEQRLRSAFALASWLRGREYDPERSQPLESSEIAAARQEFIKRTGSSPEDWLERWRAGSVADTLANNLLSHEAMSLENQQ